MTSESVLESLEYLRSVFARREFNVEFLHHVGHDEAKSRHGEALADAAGAT